MVPTARKSWDTFVLDKHKKWQSGGNCKYGYYSTRCQVAPLQVLSPVGISPGAYRLRYLWFSRRTNRNHLKTDHYNSRRNSETNQPFRNRHFPPASRRTWKALAESWRYVRRYRPYEDHDTCPATPAQTKTYQANHLADLALPFPLTNPVPTKDRGKALY